MTDEDKKFIQGLIDKIGDFGDGPLEFETRDVERLIRLVESLALPSVMVSLPKFVDAEKQKAWDKMGDTGSQQYCTDGMQWNEENYWFGYFRAMEEIEAKLEKNGQ